MTPESRYEALALAPSGELESLADQVLATGVGVEVAAGPEVVAVPVRLPVPGTETTNVVIGHVALTTCTVRVAGARGDGVRSGRDLRGALAAAICDAEAERGGPQSHAVDALATRAEAGRRDDERRLARDISLTRVEAPV